MIDFQSASFRDQLFDICLAAGDAILEVYNRDEDIKVEVKEDDSPVTEADCAANKIIVNMLNALTPDIPVLTEEESLRPFNVRREWQQYWLIDPLDGTKEFIRKSDHFTVNIALISGDKAVYGMIFVPATGAAYYGGQGVGAFKRNGDDWDAISTRSVEQQMKDKLNIEIVASKHHAGKATTDFIDYVEANIASVELKSIGSSLKFCLLAEGAADIYPRLALTSEWDTAAAQAILEAAGGAVLRFDMTPLQYNQKEDILNPFFCAIADTTFDWGSAIRFSAQQQEQQLTLEKGSA